jgi:hypothetical protein
VYDDRILCDECEPLFNEWDDYAQKVLASDDCIGFAQRSSTGQIVGWELPNYRYDQLKLFFISIVWRASVSRHSFYKRVSLGPFEREARQMIQRRDPGDRDQFAVAVARFAEPRWRRVMLDPHATRINGVKHYTFYLAGYLAYIKVDWRPSPASIGPFILSPGSPLKIISRQLSRSEAIVLRSIVTAPQNRRARMN